MTTEAESPATLLKLLQHKRDRRTVLQTRVEKTVRKLERRKHKLRAIETRIAELERRIAQPSRRVRAKPAMKDGPRKAQLIFRPSPGGDDAGKAAQLAQVVNSLRAQGIEPHIGLKASSGAAVTLARDAVEAGTPLLIVAAGDGTIKAVAAQLAGTQTRLGVIPIGTLNTRSNSLGVLPDIDSACALIAVGGSRPIAPGSNLLLPPAPTTTSAPP